MIGAWFPRRRWSVCAGLRPDGEGWFVLNAREAMWLQAEGISASCEFEGPAEFDQVGIFLG